mgnify:CR=1 FL=1
MRRLAGAALFTMLYLKNIVAALILPPLGPLMLIALGLLLLGRLPRLGRAVAWSGIALGIAMITPAAVGTLLEPLEDIPVVEPASLAGADAIVILSGGLANSDEQVGTALLLIDVLQGTDDGEVEGADLLDHGSDIPLGGHPIPAGTDALDERSHHWRIGDKGLVADHPLGVEFAPLYFPRRPL